MPLFYLVIMIMINISCSSNHKFINFPESVELKGEVKVSDDIFIRYPFRIRNDGKHIYIMDLHATDFFCHKLEFSSMTSVATVVKRGEAPGESLSAENIRLDEYNKLLTLDANKMQINSFNSNLSFNTKASVQLDKKLVRSLDFDIIDDSTFVLPDYTGKNRLCFVNVDGEIIKKSFNIPAKDSKYSGTQLAQAWRAFINYNSNTGILAMATQLGQVIEIYDIKNNSVINVAHHKSQEPEFSTHGGYAVPTGIMGYSDIHVGDEYIYAIFWGHSFDDIRTGKIKEEGGKYIHVFDMKGTPIREYILDRYITGFSVDEKNKKIIALDVNSNQLIIEYSL